MSMLIMLSGSITKQPEQRISRNGNPYPIATVRTQDSEDARFVSVTTFGDLADILADLAKGDPITMVGTGKIGTYESKDGSGTRASLSVTASRIIALIDPQALPKARATPRWPSPPVEAYNDPIPF